MSQIKASAVVDHISGRVWRVTVTGALPYPYTKIYLVDAGTEKDAAFGGINLFANEMRNREKEECR